MFVFCWQRQVDRYLLSLFVYGSLFLQALLKQVKENDCFKRLDTDSIHVEYRENKFESSGEF